MDNGSQRTNPYFRYGYMTQWIGEFPNFSLLHGYYQRLDSCLKSGLESGSESLFVV